MNELLAPAGSMESLVAAVANGADAVYLGMQRFGARAYSSNFDENGLRAAVEHAHLRGVKVYLTTNTIIYQDELDDVHRQLTLANDVGVDGVIVQDLAALTYIVQHFPDMEAHISTQMGIDDLEGALLCKELGARRVVLAREVPIEEAKRIRREADLPVELFVHGALCVSYSGNCIMSGMTGNRLGNRGRCIGSCRKLYDVVDLTDGRTLGQNYILSTKDLCTIDHVGEFDGIDSLKIEGRMKEPAYVANVVSRYRLALDGHADAADAEKLTRTFNRTFTKGYLFHEDRRDITNVDKPNNWGYEIGHIAGKRRGYYEVQLSAPLRQNDVIRIRHGHDDVNLSVAKIYDAEGRLINGADDVCFLKLKERLDTGDVVYKTKDLAFAKELEGMLTGEYHRFPLDFAVYAYPGAPLMVDATAWGLTATYASEDFLSEALKRPTTRDYVADQLDRLGDTVFCLGDVTYEDQGAFVPAKMLNVARKALVADLYAQRLAKKPRRTVGCDTPDGLVDPTDNPATEQPTTRTTMPTGAPTDPVAPSPCLTAQVTTQEQYDICRAAGIQTIYYGQNVVPRNHADYASRDGQLLIGGLGGIRHYRGTNPFVADYSLNIVNAESAHELHRLGAERVTVSYELNQHQLSDLITTYRLTYDASPHLEMIAYGHAPLLVTKYCPLKKMDQCGLCQTHRYEIREEYGAFPLMVHGDCSCTILNGRPLNLLDEMPALEGIEAFRLNFTIEDATETARIVALAQAKLDATTQESAFNPATDTRGHFHKEIL